MKLDTFIQYMHRGIARPKEVIKINEGGNVNVQYRRVGRGQKRSSII
jgi:hypothetical protein